MSIVRILGGTTKLHRYWPELKKRLVDNEGFAQLLGKIEQLKLESSDGGKYLADTANTETMFCV